jgi:hypothetical protein
VAITSLLLPSANQVNWVARALWLVSVLSAFTSVFFSCRRQSILGRLWCPENLELLREEFRGSSRTARGKNETKVVMPRFKIVIMFSLCAWFLKAAVLTYIIGLGVYLGLMWRDNLDGDAEYFGDRNIFIVFLVYAASCCLFYVGMRPTEPYSHQLDGHGECQRWSVILHSYHNDKMPKGPCKYKEELV